MERDSIEDDPRYREIFANIDSEVEAELAQHGHSMQTVGMGWGHMFNGAKQRLLKEKYGIEWKTPAEMNPDVLFD